MRTVEEVKQEIHEVEVEISILNDQLEYYDSKLYRLQEELDVMFLEQEETDVDVWADDGGVV